MNENDLSDLYIKSIKPEILRKNGTVVKVGHPTSQKGWDITISFPRKTIGVEVKYMKGPKLSECCRLFGSMISDRKPVDEIQWVFNADRSSDKGNFIDCEFFIYFLEQIGRKETERYWIPILKDVSLINIYDGTNKRFYRCTPKELKAYSKKWLGIVEKNDLGKYLNERKKWNEKTEKFGIHIVDKIPKKNTLISK